MGNYEQLKSAVSAVIKENGRQEITGKILQDTLLSIISSVGEGSVFRGVIYPSSSPGNPDQNSFYIAGQAGMYPNFGGAEVLTGTISIFKTDGADWEQQEVYVSTGGTMNVNELYKDTNNRTLQEAVSAIGGNYRIIGLCIIFKESANVWTTAQFKGENITGPVWNNTDNWEVVYRTGNGYNIDIFNVTERVPLIDNIYTLNTAIAAVPENARSGGMLLTFFGIGDRWSVYQYKKTSLLSDDWINPNNWDFISRTNVAGGVSDTNNADNIRYTGLYTLGAYSVGVPNGNYDWIISHLESVGETQSYQKAIAKADGLIVFERVRNGSVWSDWVNVYNILELGVAELAHKVADLEDRVTETESQIKSIISTDLMQYCYGIEWDDTIADTAKTRIGNLSLHASLPIQTKMRGCLLLDNGEINYYLHPNDWSMKEDGSPSVRDGSQGMVMVVLPRHYARFESEGTKHRALISELPLPGFIEIPEMFIGAYEAVLDRTNAAYVKLASVVNTTAEFRGGSASPAWDGTYRSLLGRPASYLSVLGYRNAARRRGIAGMNGAGWNGYIYQVHKNLYWLYTIEYANTDIQLPFNSALLPGGYKQGGLGVGVTIMTQWDIINNSNPFVPCGHTDSLGNNTGRVVYHLMNSLGQIHQNFQVPRYRGIENPYGHIWMWLDAVKIQVNSVESGGESLLYVCNDPSKIEDLSLDNYMNLGPTSRETGFIKKMVLGDYGEVVPLEISAFSGTHFCNYYFTSTTPTGSIIRSLRSGSSATGTTLAGIATLNSNDIYTGTGSSIGSRLCYLP